MKKVLSVCIMVFMFLIFYPAAFAAGTASIIGDDTIIRAGDGKSTVNTYSFTVDGIPTEADWSLTEPADGVVMFSDGALVLHGLTANNDVAVTISAAAKNNPELTAIKTVKILKLVYYEDFESAQVGEKADAGSLNAEGEAKIQLDETGNKYRKASGEWSNANASIAYPSANYLSKASVGTFEGKFRLDNDSANGPAFNMPFRMIGANDSSFALYINLEKNANGKVSITSSHNSIGQNTTVKIADNVVDVGEWFNIRLTADFTNKVYSIYVNNVLCADRYQAQNPEKFQRFSGYCRMGTPHDDLTFYSGELIIPNISRKVPETVMLLPGKGSARINMDTTLNAGNFSLKNGITFTADTPAYIENNILFIPENVSGSINVTAVSTQFSITKTETINIVQGAYRDFESDSINSIPTGVLSTSTAIVAEEGSNRYLDASENKNVDFDMLSIDGRVLVEAKVRKAGTNPKALLFSNSETKEINLSAATAEWEKLVIVADTIRNTCTAFIGSTIILNNDAFNHEKISVLSFKDIMLDDVTYHSVVSDSPYVFNLSIDGKNTVGQNITANYTYFSPGLLSQTGEDVIWYASDSENGNYIQAGSGKNLRILSNLANKYIKYSLTCSNEGGISPIVYSEPIFISDLFTITQTEVGIDLYVSNGIGRNDFLAVAELYRDGKVTDILAQKVAFSSETEEVSFAVEKSTYEGALLMLLNPDSLAPISIGKVIGITPPQTGTECAAEEGITATKSEILIKTESDKVVSVLIYGHDAAPDTVSRFATAYQKSDLLELIDDTQKSLFSVLKSVYVVTTGANGTAALKIPILDAGAYRMEMIANEGNSVNAQGRMLIKAEELLGTSGTANMSEPKFQDVLAFFTDKTDTEIQKIYNYYTKLTNKTKVASFLSDFDYDIGKFYLTTLTCAYLEQNNSNETIKEQLLAELSLYSYATTGVELLQHDCNFESTAKAINSSTQMNFSLFLNEVFDKAVRYGIYHVSNFREADIFLSALGNTFYDNHSSKTYICQMVAGNFYDDMVKLVTKVESYKEPEGSMYGGGGGGKSKTSSGSYQVSAAEDVKVNETFFDLNSTHWANNSILYLRDNGILDGTPEGYFYPENNITRAEFVKVLCKAFDIQDGICTEFADVSDDDWFAPFVRTANSAGIVKGYDGKFFPNKPITREDAVVMVYRAMTSKGIIISEGKSELKDLDTVSDYAKEIVVKMNGAKIVNGTGEGIFSPKNNITRAETAKLIANVLRGELN